MFAAGESDSLYLDLIVQFSSEEELGLTVRKSDIPDHREGLK